MDRAILTVQQRGRALGDHALGGGGPAAVLTVQQRGRALGDHALGGGGPAAILTVQQRGRALSKDQVFYYTRSVVSYTLAMLYLCVGP